jgi:4-hydroxybenzoate polyprenyltransferase
MRSFASISFVLIILILIDLYVFKGLKALVGRKKPQCKKIFRLAYWIFSLLLIAAFVFSTFIMSRPRNSTHTATCLRSMPS